MNTIQFEFPGENNWYFVFNNKSSNNTLQHVVARASLYEYYSSEIKSLVLLETYPNPINIESGGTVISYQLPEKSNVSLIVYNILGQKVKTLVNDLRYASTYTTIWDGRNENGKLVPSGVFFYHLKTKYADVSKKVLVVH
jgi:hypothetical protein